MKKYRYEGTKVIETATELVINKYKSKEEAKRWVGILNKGDVGFQGDTPNFFCYAKDQA